MSAAPTCSICLRQQVPYAGHGRAGKTLRGDPSGQQGPQETWRPWTEQEKKELAAQVEQQAGLMKYCLEAAQRFVDGGLVEGDLAIELFKEVMH